MSGRDEYRAPSAGSRDRKALLLSGLLLLLAAAGLLHVFFGTWRPSPGGNAWLVPLLCFVVIVPAAVLMARQAWRDGADTSREEGGSAVVVLATAVWAMAFFNAVQWLGLVTGTWLAMAMAMLALSPRPLQAAKSVVPLAVLTGIMFWLMFTRLAPLVLREPIFF